MSRIAVYCLVVVALLAATSAFHASSRWIAGPKQKLSALSESKQKFSFLEILSGKAAVAAEKRSSPTLFSTAPTKKVAAKKMGKISALAQEAIAIYKKCYPAPKAGGSMDLDDNAIAFCFGELTRFTKDEKATLEMVKNAPSILQKDLARSKDNFAVYEGKYGFDGALGLVQRNPLILAIATTGYGSAEVAGPETIAASYLIAFTRPIGAPLLVGLFGLLLTPLFKAFIHIQ